MVISSVYIENCLLSLHHCAKSLGQDQINF